MITFATLLDIGAEAIRTIAILAVGLAATEMLLGISAGRKP